MNLSLKDSFLKNFELRLILVLVLYAFLGIILLRYYQYQINPDAIQYIGIAKLYLSGDFVKAINPYWGPFLSWLLIPFLFLGQNPGNILYSAKILSLIVGIFTIIGVRQLSYRFEMSEVIRTVILFSLVPIVLYFSFSFITPDLLLVAILVFYLNIIFNQDYPNKLHNGLFCGILGAFAFFTKSFAFLFFLAHFLLFNIFHYFGNKDQETRKKIFKNLFLGLAVFLIVSSVWVGLISNDVGKITFGTSGEINYALAGPETQGVSPHQGLSKPGEQEIPKSWSPFSSYSNFKYQLTLIWNNTIRTLVMYQNFSYFYFIILLAYIILLIQPLNKLILDRDVLYPLTTILILSGGYIPVLLEERYLWLVNILLILMGGYLLNLLFKSDLFTKARKIVLILLFASSFILMPASYLVYNTHTGEDSYRLSNVLIDNYNIQGNVASNDKVVYMGFLEYYLNFTYYGQAKKDVADEELQNQFKKYDISYYFFWSSSNQNSEFLSKNYPEITNGSIKGLKIYAIK